MNVQKIAVIGALIVGFVSCSAGEDKAAAKAGVARFRAQVAQDQFAEMYNDWEEARFRGTTSEDFIHAMKSISTQLGAHQSSKQVEWRAKHGADGTMITLEYETVFEKKGKAKERFVFRVKDGEAHLARYHLGGVSISLNPEDSKETEAA